MELTKEKLVRFYSEEKQRKGFKLWGRKDGSSSLSSVYQLPSTLKSDRKCKITDSHKFGRSKVFPEDHETFRMRILDPGSEIVLKWNKVFIVSCLMALFVDPLYFYLPSIGGVNDSWCVKSDVSLRIVVTFLRTIADLFYLLHVVIKFRTAYVAPSSRVFGRGELVRDPKKIARRYIRSDLFIDLIATLPLPQIVIWFIIPATRSRRANRNNNALALIVLLQYVPRLYLIFPLSSEIIKATGVVTKTAWAGAAYNLLLYMLASHVLGAAWYVLSVDRYLSCWKSICKKEISPGRCFLEYLDCDTSKQDERNIWINTTNVFRSCDPDNDIHFNFGIFENAVSKNVVSSSFLQKYFYCLWWGLQNLRLIDESTELLNHINENLEMYRKMQMLTVKKRNQCLRIIQQFHSITASTVLKLEEAMECFFRPLQIKILILKENYEMNVTGPEFIWTKSVNKYIYRETAFAILIAILGLVLFAHLIGNMQTYLQSLTIRLEEWRLKRRDTEEWMQHRQLPEDLRKRVRRFVQYKWLATRGVNEETILRGLPADLRRDIQCHLCLDLVRRVPFFSQMDDQLLDAICERLVSSLSTEGTYIVCEGDPVTEMLFIIRGRLESSTTNGGRTGFLDSITLRPGDFCGEELLAWALLPKSTVNLPSSTRTVRALVEVEAFALRAEDLKFVANQFRRLHSKKLQHTFRFYSHHWRTWAACFIQAAWRRYKRRKMAKDLVTMESFTSDEMAAADSKKVEQNLGTDSSNSGRISKLGVTILASKFAANTRRNAQKIRDLGSPKLQKPEEPDFSVETDD